MKNAYSDLKDYAFLKFICNYPNSLIILRNHYAKLQAYFIHEFSHSVPVKKKNLRKKLVFVKNQLIQLLNLESISLKS